MIEYLLAGLSLGGLIVYLFTKNMHSKSDPFTLKSDGKTDIDINKITPKQDRVSPISDSSENNENQLPKQIDMTGITGIRLDGGDDLQIFADYIKVSETAVIELRKRTLFIKSQNTNTVIINGKVISGNNINIASNIRTNGSVNISNISVSSQSSAEMIKIPLINFKPKTLDRVSIQGSGSVDIHNILCNSDMDIVIQGSGDVRGYNCQFEDLTVSIQGSGDVTLNKDCQADNLDLSISGSGKIISKIKQIENINKSISGSGKINCVSDKKKVTETTTGEGIEDLMYQLTTSDPKRRWEQLVSGGGITEEFGY